MFCSEILNLEAENMNSFHGLAIFYFDLASSAIEGNCLVFSLVLGCHLRCLLSLADVNNNMLLTWAPRTQVDVSAVACTHLFDVAFYQQS